VSAVVVHLELLHRKPLRIPVGLWHQNHGARALHRRCNRRQRIPIHQINEGSLLHGDLLHGNVLVSPDARRVEAVLSWKCSVRGDFLFDAAWCSFWAPWHPGIAAADPLSGLLRAPDVRDGPGALRDAAARHHCYELHIGFTHLGWNVWTGNQADLAATARRLAEILERGPLPGAVEEAAGGPVS